MRIELYVLFWFFVKWVASDIYWIVHPVEDITLTFFAQTAQGWRYQLRLWSIVESVLYFKSFAMSNVLSSLPSLKHRYLHLNCVLRCHLLWLLLGRNLRALFTTKLSSCWGDMAACTEHCTGGHQWGTIQMPTSHRMYDSIRHIHWGYSVASVFIVPAGMQRCIVEWSTLPATM